MPFDIAPLPESHAGENFGRGLLAIGDAIREHKAKSDELKGYKTILTALASDPQNGINPDQIDKMSLPVAKNTILTAEIKRQQAAVRLQQQATAAIPGFLSAFASNQQPQANVGVRPLGAPAGDPLSAATGAAFGAPTPGMNPQNALGDALRRFSPVLNDPDVRKSVLAAAIKNGLMPSRSPQPFSMNGVTGVVDPATGRITQPRIVPRVPLSQTPVPDDWPPATKKVGNITYYQARPGGEFRPLGLGEQNNGDLHLKVEDGKTFYRSGDNQAWKPMPATKSGIDFSTPEGMGAFLKQAGKDGDGGTPSLPDNRAAGTVITDADGKQWRYKGTAEDPKTDTDESNWEPVQ